MEVKFFFVFLVWTTINLGCSTSQPIVDEEGWPTRPHSQKLRCPLQTNLEDTTFSDGSRSVFCQHANNPLPRGFKAIWNKEGKLRSLYKTDDDGTPLSRVGYHNNGNKSSEEVFVDGKLQTSRAWFDDNALKYEALKNEKGIWISRWDNLGKIEYQGLLRKGKRQGKWLEFVDGAMETSNYVDHLREGNSKRVYLDGSVEQGMYLNGNKTGLWTRNLNGSAIFKLEYLNGQLHGKAIRFHPNGAPNREGFYNKGQKTGKWNSFYPSGQVKSTGNYECGKHGIWKTFFSLGELESEGEYVHDSKTGIWKFWNEKGQTLDVEEYKLETPLKPCNMGSKSPVSNPQPVQ